MAKVFIDIQPEELDEQPSLFRATDGTVMVLLRVDQFSKYPNFLKLLGPRGVIVGFASDSLECFRIAQELPPNADHS